MKAAQINDYGGKDAVRLQETPMPQLKPDEVLIEVYAAGVNPFDWKVRDGLARQMAELNMPATLGGDLAGMVAEIGAEVADFQIGQSVYGLANALSGHGSFAEFAPVKADSLAAKPQSADFVQAAALPLAAVSAYQALVEHMQLKVGQKILIHGAAGGIGSIAVQIAKNIGAYVATTAGINDLKYVKSLGADEVIDYTNQDFTVLKNYDAVFDTVGGDTFSRSYLVLKPGGVLVSMTAEPDKELSQKYAVETIHQYTLATTGKLQAIAQLVDKGKIKAHIEKVYPLEHTADALEDLKTGHSKGKRVIKLKD